MWLRLVAFGDLKDVSFQGLGCESQVSTGRICAASQVLEPKSSLMASTKETAPAWSRSDARFLHFNDGQVSRHGFGFDSVIVVAMTRAIFKHDNLEYTYLPSSCHVT